MIRTALASLTALTLAAPALAQDSGEAPTPPPDQADLNREKEDLRADAPEQKQATQEEKDAVSGAAPQMEAPEISFAAPEIIAAPEGKDETETEDAPE